MGSDVVDRFAAALERHLRGRPIAEEVDRPGMDEIDPASRRDQADERSCDQCRYAVKAALWRGLHCGLQTRSLAAAVQRQRDQPAGSDCDTVGNAAAGPQDHHSATGRRGREHARAKNEQSKDATAEEDTQQQVE